MQGLDCKHYVVEHDADWINFFKNTTELSSGTEIVNLNLQKYDICEEGVENTFVNAYEGFQDVFKDKKFDLIFIDGPFGSPLYSRMDVIDLLPECLDDSFVLMLDDAERLGENNTLKMIINIMEENNIACSMNYYSGVKATAIVTSKDLHFLCTM